MEAREILQRAADYFCELDRWTQKKLYEYDAKGAVVKCCLVGSLNVAAECGPNQPHRIDCERITELGKATAAVRRVLIDNWGLNPSRSIGEWNDDYRRDQSDVRQILHAARASLS